MRRIRRVSRVLLAASLGLIGAGIAASPAVAVRAGGPLPDTGSSVQWWIIAAIVVLALGGGLYALSKRAGK